MVNFMLCVFHKEKEVSPMSPMFHCYCKRLSCTKGWAYAGHEGLSSLTPDETTASGSQPYLQTSNSTAGKSTTFLWTWEAGGLGHKRWQSACQPGSTLSLHRMLMGGLVPSTRLRPVHFSQRCNREAHRVPSPRGSLKPKGISLWGLYGPHGGRSSESALLWEPAVRLGRRSQSLPDVTIAKVL